MINDNVNKKILEEAQKTDEEICGVIISGEPVFLDNAAANPREEFLIRDMPEEAEAVFHSHPGGPFYPTLLDMRQQYATMLPWGIASFNSRHKEVFWFGDGIQKPDLIGRPFRHGVTDCYSIIRDFYSKIHGIEIPEYPREWEWWNDNQSMYNDNFKEAGFHEIPMSDIAPGDVFFATIRSKTPNHGGIYLGNGLILHHTSGRDGYDPFRLSNVEPAARWFNYLSKVVRHEDDTIDRTVGQGVWK